MNGSLQNKLRKTDNSFVAAAATSQTISGMLPSLGIVVSCRGAWIALVGDRPLGWSLQAGALVKSDWRIDDEFKDGFFVISEGLKLHVIYGILFDFWRC